MQWTKGWATRLTLTAATAAGGCDPLWVRANQSQATGPRLLGPQVSPGGGRQLVVGYRAWPDGAEVPVSVPLAADGWPLPPFRPATAIGLDRDADRPFVHGVPEAQQRQIVADLAARPPVTAALPTISDGEKRRPFYAPTRTDGLVLLPYTVDPQGQGKAVEIDPILPNATAVTFATGPRLALLPAGVPRPQGEQRRDLVTAAFVEPVAVPCEALAFTVAAVLVVPALPFVLPMAAALAPRPGRADGAFGRSPQPPPVIVPVRILPYRG